MTITVPVVGGFRPLKIASSVDFPDPLGPSKHTNSRGRTTTLTSFNSGNGSPVRRFRTTRLTALRDKFDVIGPRAAGQPVAVELKRKRPDVDAVSRNQGNWICDASTVDISSIRALEVDDRDPAARYGEAGVPSRNVGMVEQILDKPRITADYSSGSDLETLGRLRILAATICIARRLPRFAALPSRARSGEWKPRRWVVRWIGRSRGGPWIRSQVAERRRYSLARIRRTTSAKRGLARSQADHATMRSVMRGQSRVSVSIVGGKLDIIAPSDGYSRSSDLGSSSANRDEDVPLDSWRRILHCRPKSISKGT